MLSRKYESQLCKSLKMTLDLSLESCSKLCAVLVYGNKGNMIPFGNSFYSYYHMKDSEFPYMQ